MAQTAGCPCCGGTVAAEQGSLHAAGVWVQHRCLHTCPWVCWHWEVSGEPSLARDHHQLHACSVPSPTRPTPARYLSRCSLLQIIKDLGGYLPASLCKRDLPALSSITELSGLSQPAKLIINPPNDQFSFYLYKSNLENVYSSIVPHTEA